MATFGWSRDHVMFEVPGAEGWVWYNWATENEATVWGQELERRSPGYVKREKERLLRQWRTRPAG